MCLEAGCASLSSHAKIQRTIQIHTPPTAIQTIIHFLLLLFFGSDLSAFLAEHHTCRKETRCVLPSHVSGAVQALSVPSLQSLTCHCGNHHLATSTWAYLSLVGIACAYGDMASETTSFPLVPTGCRAGKFDSANAQGKVAQRPMSGTFSYVPNSRAVYKPF